MSELKVLQCGVVDAGIVRLAVAIALRKAGHNVAIFERSTVKNEVGAAITLTPNADLNLDQWSFDAAKAGETLEGQFRKVTWDTMEVVSRNSFCRVTENYGGHKFSAFHRVDLHNGMREMAQVMSVAIRLASEVYEIDCDAGTLRLTDGTETQKDLIV